MDSDKEKRGEDNLNVFTSNRIDILADDLVRTVSLQNTPFHKNMILTPNDTISRMIGETFLKKKGVFFGLKRMSLEKGCFTLLEKWTGEVCRTPCPLTLYLSVDTALKEAPIEKQYRENDELRTALALRLSREFLRWQFYDKKDIFTENVWIEHLFTRLQEDFFFFHQFDFSQCTSSSIVVHLFGFTQMPSFLLSFFKKAALFIDVHWYLFSPSRFLWWDFQSDRGLEFLKTRHRGKSFQEYVSLSKEDHRLIANFATHGKELFSALDHVPFTSRFETEGTSFLSHIRRDIVESEITPFRGRTPCIELHKAPAKMAEVEILVERICSHLHRLHLSEKDVLVACPDIIGYAPYIRLVFEREGCPLGYRIEDGVIGAASFFSKFFALLEPNRNTGAIIALFAEEDFYRRQEWSAEEAQRIVEFFQTFSLRSGSILDGYRRYLFQLPLKETRFDDLELLGDAVAVLENLTERIDGLITASMEASEWSATLRNLIEDFSIDSEERAVISVKLGHLYKIRGRFSFVEIIPFLRNIVQPPLLSIENKDHFVTFVPFEDGRIISRPVIYLLGMDETSFPPPITFHSLQKQSLIENGHLPMHLSRYAFLTCVMQASILIISYASHDNDAKEMEVSLVVQSFLRFIESTYGICLLEQAHDPIPFVLPQKKSVQASFAQKHPDPIVIDIRDIARLFSHPLRFFGQKGLGIFLSDDKEKVSLGFSKEELRQFKREALNHFRKNREVHNVWDAFETVTPIEKAKKNRLEHTVGALVRGISALGYHEKNPRELHFSPVVDTIQSNDGFLIVPSPTFRVRGTTITVIGKMEDVYEEGIFSLAKENRESRIEEIVRFLIAKETIPSLKEISFAGSETVWNISLFRGNLETYFEYILTASKIPSPLFPETVTKAHREKNLDYDLWRSTLDPNFSDPYIEQFTPSFDHDWRPTIDALMEDTGD